MTKLGLWGRQMESQYWNQRLVICDKCSKGDEVVANKLLEEIINII